MIPDRIGIIGKVQGVNASNRPKPKNDRSTIGALVVFSIAAIEPDSSPATVAGGTGAAAATSLPFAGGPPARPPSSLSSTPPPRSELEPVSEMSAT